MAKLYDRTFRYPANDQSYAVQNQRLLDTYTHAISLGKSYGALDKALVAPEPADGVLSTTGRADLKVSLTVGATVRALGVEISLRDVKSSQAPVPAAQFDADIPCIRRGRRCLWPRGR